MSHSNLIFSKVLFLMFLTGCPKKSDTTEVQTQQETKETFSVTKPESSGVQKQAIAFSKYDTLAECAIEDASSEEAEAKSIEQAQHIKNENQKIQVCFDQQGTELPTSVELSISIAEGKVTSVLFQNSEFASSELATCIQDKISQWTYFNNCSDTGSLIITTQE